MLIWLNGPFGVGKTQTAFELHRRLPGSQVVDPEQIGFALRRISPRAIWPDDFQALPQWREAVRAHLAWIGTRFDGIAIVPMTVLDPAWHDEIVGALHRDHVPLRHYTLTADEATVRARLAARGDGGRAWHIERLLRYLPTLHLPQFATHIDTLQIDIPTVAERIATDAGLALQPRGARALAPLRRLAVTLRHVRFG